MKLIVILVCLGLERYLNAGSVLKRFSWFDSYWGLLQSTGKSSGLWRGYAGVAWSILPIFLIVGLVYWILVSLFHDVARLLFGLIIFFYCLGPEEFFSLLPRFFAAKESNNTADSQAIASEFLGMPAPASETETHRKISESIFSFSYLRFLGVIFWFVVLGPMAALLYRVSLLAMQKVESEPQTYDASLLQSFQVWTGLLDWAPIRIVTLVYGLVGHFSHCFSEWIKFAMTGFQNQRAMLSICGLRSIDKDPYASETANLEENKMALHLVERTMIVLLVLIAIFTLGAWIA